MATTTNLALHQWQAGDAFLREDFNGDFRKIDAAVAAAATGGFVAGHYAGVNSVGTVQKIRLGFSPSAVIICQQKASFSMAGTIFTKSAPLYIQGLMAAEMTNDGFQVCMVEYMKIIQTPRLTNGGDLYVYIAFR